MLLSFVSLWVSLAFAGADLNPQLGKVVSGDGPVWIFKQWHLPPTADTRQDPKTPRAQAQNQTAIYRQLEAWVEAGHVETVLAEGCSGEIKSGFLPIFNGWDFDTLTRAKAKFSAEEYAAIVSHVPLKLEVRFGDKVKTLCAEDSKVLTEHSRAFSDARGAAGFLTRLEQYRNDPRRAKEYREGAIQAFRFEPGISTEAVIKLLRGQLGTLITKIKEGFGARNQAIVDTIGKLPSQDKVALVIGGAHVQDIQARLEKAGLGARVVEPVGYASDAEKTLSEFEKLTKGTK